MEAARAVGVREAGTLVLDIVLNSMAPMIVLITMDLGAVVLVAAALSYIGFGVPPGKAVNGGRCSWMDRATSSARWNTTVSSLIPGGWLRSQEWKSDLSVMGFHCSATQPSGHFRPKCAEVSR